MAILTMTCGELLPGDVVRPTDFGIPEEPGPFVRARDVRVEAVELPSAGAGVEITLTVRYVGPATQPIVVERA